VALLVVLAAASLGLAVHRSSWDGLRAPAADAAASSGTTSDAGLAEVGILGLKAGALSFGGAYTAIPLLQQDAVEQGGWLTEQELLQGVALVSVMPAPLVIVVTYVGGIAAGAAGALVMTIAILLPAFVITLFGHRSLERIVDQPRVHDLLDGVVAGVVGLIGVTALSLAATLVDTLLLAAILVAALVTLHAWRSIRASAFVVLAAGAFGAVLGPAFGL
jgi:chromate transporter